MDSKLNQVHRGMHVVDATGKDVGKIDMIRMGDEVAATTAGNQDMPERPLDLVAEAFGGDKEPDVPEPLRSRLVRSGYLKVDGANLFDSDRYVSVEHVQDVADDRVRLSVSREELIRED